MIEVYTLGGFLEIGRNMTVVRYKDESVIIDMGLHMPNYISLTEEEDVAKVDYQKLLDAKAAPDIRKVQKIAPSVKAIIPTHAHLDHVGAIPYFAPFFPNAEILGTRFTCAVLRHICEEENIKIKNKIVDMNSNSIYWISKNLKVEFVRITHSTPQTVLVIIHTPEGKVAYANDYKFDSTPIIGKKPNKQRLKKVAPVKLLIMDTLYGDKLGKTPSEAVASNMLKDILFDDEITPKNAVIVTTFSSHIARIKSICDFAKGLKRQPVFLGRSLKKYLDAATESNIFKLPKNAIIFSYRRQVNKFLKELRENPSKYLVTVTGHQAEKKAILARMADGDFGFKKDDAVVFSCNVIPGGDNDIRREALEANLEAKGVRVFEDVHVSGHASREDHRMLLEILSPELVIPAHSTIDAAKPFSDFCESKKLGKIIISKEGDVLNI